MTGIIFDVKEMAVHDGPGVRTTVFFKGCPLRCRWCHNPEGLSPKPQLMVKQARCRQCGLCRRPCSHPDCQPYGRCLHICPENCLTVSGETVTAEELAQRLIRSAQLLPGAFGGFTFSGGEPLMQSDFLIDVLDRVSGYERCIETSGYAPEETFRQVAKHLDRVILDIKLADAQQHREYTGVDNAPILANFEWLRRSGIPYIIRTPMIPGITDTPENRAAIRGLVGDSPWELIPYNEMAGAKYPMLGMTYPLE